MIHSHIIEYFKELSIHPKNAEELKGLILQLAVEGKLTEKWREENPNVEPASELLKRIKEEKALLIKEKKIKIKKEKALPEIEDDEKPFKLPPNWTFCRWVDLLDNDKYSMKRGPFGSALKKDFFVESGVRVFEQYNAINDDPNWVRYYVNDEKFEELKAFKADVGDLLISCSGTLGRICELTKGTKFGIINQALLKVRLNNKLISNSYFINLFRSNYIQTRIYNKATGSAIVNMVGVKELKNFIIPLPPINEQVEIIKTINILFAEIEQLEEQTKKRIQLKEDFATSSLQQLTSSDTENAWTVLKPHFQTFFTTQPNVKKLREAILQLAVQGKLTHHWRKQNPNVEPASELLKLIQEEKAQLIKEKKIKKEKALPKITEEEIPFELPEGWSWCRMQDISIKLGAGSTPSGGKSAYVEEGIKFFRSQNIYNDGLRLENVALITDAIHEKMKGTKVLPKDLLLNITGGSIGRCTLVPDDFDTANVSQHVAIVRLQELGIRSFIHTLIISPQFQQTIMDVQVGVSREGLSMTKLKQFLVPLPPLEEVQAIKDITNNLLALCYQLETSLSEKEGVELDWMKSVING
ncbi:restriction endonuclease subunit S [Flammeovirga sp. MY04]|uniref:restriction endonuclease subunit S n=1 Tax=Flammeovirga sp. MY04 TaxID=1191459 RepID=UPI0008061060|nr:restriction endonuclease subunit S [Flammeovirga sp. MY04]ANQ48062.1 restriction endonuclease subunit S [Flammeovirga sp. MY04]